MYQRGQNYYKIYFSKSRFGTISFVKLTKQSLHKGLSLARSLANRDKPMAATLQRNSPGGVIFNHCKAYYKKNRSKEFFCNRFG